MSLVKVCGIKIKFQKYYEPSFNCIFLDKKYSITHQRWQAAYDLGKFVYNYNHEINPYSHVNEVYYTNFAENILIPKDLLVPLMKKYAKEHQFDTNNLLKTNIDSLIIDCAKEMNVSQGFMLFASENMGIFHKRTSI